MSKEDFIKKFNIKDYNNELEKILEYKPFSEDTKNLLLSMLYKIENSYKDYKEVKQDVYKKQDLIENILKIIEASEWIRIVNPRTKEAKLLEEKEAEFIVNQDEQKIIVYPNERQLLYAIFKLSNNKICINPKYFPIDRAISGLLNIGNDINNSEIIRDFNGWTWEISKKEIENISYNLIFQNLIYLIGYEFISSWINNIDNKKDYLEEFEQDLELKYGQKNKNEILNSLYKIAIKINSELDKNEEKSVNNFIQNKKQELELLENKKEFLQDITNKKKDLTNQIGKIDAIINDKELMRDEYKKRNSKLANKDKIFSISHLYDILEKERQEALNKIKEYNSLLDPKGYVNKKEKLNKEVEFLENITSENDEEDVIIKFQKAFLACFTILIKKVETKKEIIELIYKFRYYNLLPYNEELNISQIEELKENIEKTEKILINRALELTALEKISKDDNINFDILKNIFNTKIISIENINIIIKKEEILKIQIYDTNILENEIVISNKKEDVKTIIVKLEKNIKIIK